MTALSFWDYSVDKRGGSNSIIFAPSLTISPEDILSEAQRRFPQVFARLPAGVTLKYTVNPPKSPWKDIADAPKDGTEILMLRPSGKRIVVWWDANGWKSGDGVGHLALTPHAKWRHLPEATS